MSRQKKLLVMAAVLLLFLGDYLYWTMPFSLGKAVPEENWNRAQLWYYDEHFDMQEIPIDETALQQLLTGIENAKVTIRPGFRTVSQPYFHLYLYYGEGYPSSFTIVENGDISIAAELNTDRRTYFDGGEELYQTLLSITGAA